MRRRPPWLFIVVAVLVAAGALAPSVRAAAAEDQEIQIGRRGAAQIESRLKVVADPAVADRLARVGAAVAAQSQRPRLPYTFKAVESPQVNAVALPGGFIYVTTGLLKFVRSDHELAAVLAHEASHAALGHGMEMMRRANQAMFVTLLIAIVTRDPSLVQGAALFSSGLMAGYTRDLEREADIASIDYLSRTSYSPVGVLTVLERLMRQEQLAPQPEPVFPDHPKVGERVQYVQESLRARRIPLNRRAPANWLEMVVRETLDGGTPFSEIIVNGRSIVRLADAARIRETADVLDRLFDGDLEPYEIMARETQGGWAILARGFSILRLSPADAPGGTVRELATSISIRLKTVIEDDIRRRRMNG